MVAFLSTEKSGQHLIDSITGKILLYPPENYFCCCDDICETKLLSFAKFAVDKPLASGKVLVWISS